MKRNPLVISDIVVGLLLAAILVLPLIHYSYAANEIAEGRFTVGGDLSGIFATHIPDHLRAGPFLFMFGFPAVVFYVVWMLVHSFAGGWLWLAATASVLITIPVGFIAFAEAFLSPPEDALASASAIALSACLVVVGVEIVLSVTLRRRRPDSNPALPWGSL